MFRLAALLCAVGVWGQGRPATAEEIRKLDLTVFRDGRGLPVGKGTAVAGRIVYKKHCAECHNDAGEGREQQYPALVGGGFVGDGEAEENGGKLLAVRGDDFRLYQPVDAFRSSAEFGGG